MCHAEEFFDFTEEEYNAVMADDWQDPGEWSADLEQAAFEREQARRSLVNRLTANAASSVIAITPIANGHDAAAKSGWGDSEMNCYLCSQPITARQAVEYHLCATSPALAQGDFVFVFDGTQPLEPADRPRTRFAQR